VIATEKTPDGVDVHTEPEDDGGESGAYLTAGVIAGGQNHSASVLLTAEHPSDEEVADGLLKAVAAAAQMHSSGAWMAVQRRLA